MSGQNNESNPVYRWKSLALAISAALAGTQAQAQDPVIEEIIVTATKRAASAQDIPQAITAFGTAAIERRGFEGIDDFAAFIPSLAQSSIEPGGNSVVFRGVAASGLQFGANPSSGVYLDEQPITISGRNPDPRLIDIERIEALSGPQGTLFGDASQSGTLRIITNKPNSREFDGWVDAGINTIRKGDTGYDLSGMVNVPLVADRLALRVVGFSSEEAGYIDNVLRPSPGGTFDNARNVEDDVNTIKYYGGRVALRWQPTDDLTVDASAIFQDMDVDGFGDVNLDVGDLEQVRFQDEQFKEDWQQFALTVERRFEHFDLLLTGSIFQRDFVYDADATDYQFAFNQVGDYVDAQYPYYDLTFYDFGGDPRAFAFDSNDDKKTTFEARIATRGDSDSRWNGVVGFFYNKSDESALFTSGNEGFAGSPAFYYLAYNPYNPSLNGLPPGSWGPTNNWFFGVYDSEVEQTAVFGEVTFDVTERFSITAGGRYFNTKRDVELFQGALQQGPFPSRATDFITNDERGTSNESDFVPKLGFTYNFDDDKMVYATYSEGFRSGGANAVRPNSILPRSFSSDILENLEVGAKTTWANGRFQLNVNAYTMNWKDIQIQVNDPQPLVFSLGFVNFPEAQITGLEADFRWLPAAGWDISGVLGYNEAEISQTATLFAGTDSPIVAQDGARLPLAPDWKAALGVQYTFQQKWFNAEPYLRFDYAYVGDSINSLVGLESVVFAPGPTPQDDYDVLDASFGLTGDRWSASLFIDNVTDERAEQFFSNRWGKQRLSVNRPRTIGLNLRWHFR